MSFKNKPAATLAIALTACALILGCSGGPEFNPLPAGDGSPVPTVRKHTGTPIAPGTPFTGFPTAIATPTPELVSIPFVSTFAQTRARVEADPNGFLLDSLIKFEHYGSLSVESSFYNPVFVEGAGDEPVTYVRVSVEGEYSHPWAIDNAGRFDDAGPPDINMRFFQEAVEGVTLPSGETYRAEAEEMELQATMGRFKVDTTDVDLPVYWTYAEFTSAYDRDWTKRPDRDMFLITALTGRPMFEHSVQTLMKFEPGELRLVTFLDDSGSEYYVLEATKSRPNGDVEEWTFWIDGYRLLRRVGLTVTNEQEPTRNVRDAVLEITNYSQCIRYWCTHIDTDGA